MEKLPVPVVAAINGAATGRRAGNLRWAANRRIVVDDPRAVVGTPEVGIGLLPGAGGCIRLPALIGLEKALPILLEGKPRQAARRRSSSASSTKSWRPTHDLIPTAKAWIKDEPGSRTPSHGTNAASNTPAAARWRPNVRNTIRFAPTMVFNKTRGLHPGPEKILDVSLSTRMRMGFDIRAARRIPRRWPACWPGPTPAPRSQTFFFGMQAIKQGKVRPAGEPLEGRRPPPSSAPA